MDGNDAHQIYDAEAHQCDECLTEQGLPVMLIEVFGNGIFFDGETWYCPNCGAVLYVD